MDRFLTTLFWVALIILIGGTLLLLLPQIAFAQGSDVGAALEPFWPQVIEAIVLIVQLAIAAFFSVASLYLPPMVRAFVRQSDIDALTNAITRYVRKRLVEGADMLGASGIEQTEAYLKTTMPDTIKKRQPTKNFVEAAIKEVLHNAK